MIEISGTILGDPALQIRMEELADDGYEVTYAVKIGARDADGDHLFSRTITVRKYAYNILGLLQEAIFQLDIEHLLCRSGIWNPRPSKSPLELS